LEPNAAICPVQVTKLLAWSVKDFDRPVSLHQIAWQWAALFCETYASPTFLHNIVRGYEIPQGCLRQLVPIRSPNIDGMWPLRKTLSLLELASEKRVGRPKRLLWDIGKRFVLTRTFELTSQWSAPDTRMEIGQWQRAVAEGAGQQHVYPGLHQAMESVTWTKDTATAFTA
jgi:hypothetical protein